MNIIKYDNYFSQVITVDNTQITIDNTDITFDNLDEDTSCFRMEILPRKYDTNIIVEITEPLSNNTIELVPINIIDNGILNIKLDGFEPQNDVVYDVNIYNHIREILWYGQSMFTSKNIQDYHLDNSDENNLRF